MVNETHPLDAPWHGVRRQDNGGLTLEGIRDMLRPRRRRLILFFNGDDREVVTSACRTLRDEGYELAEREHRWVEAGRVIAVDADVLQPEYLNSMIGSLFDG